MGLGFVEGGPGQTGVGACLMGETTPATVVMARGGGSPG